MLTVAEELMWLLEGGHHWSQLEFEIKINIQWLQSWFHLAVLKRIRPCYSLGGLQMLWTTRLFHCMQSFISYGAYICQVVYIIYVAQSYTDHSKLSNISSRPEEVDLHALQDIDQKTITDNEKPTFFYKRHITNTGKSKELTIGNNNLPLKLWMFCPIMWYFIVSQNCLLINMI